MKKVLSVLMSAILLITLMQALTACANKPGETGNLKTDAPAQTALTESKPESRPISSAETAEATGTETDEAANTDNKTVSINTEILDEYMMTYSELSNKHGKLIDFQRFDGGNWYKLENGYGYYWFYFLPDINKTVTDTEYGFNYFPVEDDSPCRGIRNIPLDLLFNGAFDTILIKDIANIDGLHYIGTYEDNITTTKGYVSKFTYDGWNNDSVIFYLYHEDENMIDMTSEARFWIHPLIIDEQEAQQSE